MLSSSITKLEKQLLADILFWRKKFNECNPKAGFAPLDETVLNDILEKYLDLSVSDREKAEIIKLVQSPKGF